MADHDERTRGLWATTAAFLIWGFVPIYWKAVSAIPAREMIAYRVLWALPFLALLLLWRGGWRRVRATLKRPRVLAVLAGSAALIAVNWFLFIEAVNDGQIMQTSLGYYINPLVNVLLGFALLGERLRRLQLIAVLLAGAGVAVLVFQAGEVPLIALALAITFGLYGLVRKLVPIDALPGLFFEVIILLPFALLWLGVRVASEGIADVGWGVWLLLPLAGLITALPLSWFAYGARRLTLTTVGLLQFLAPTGQFLLAILVYDEAFTTAHLITFALIWAGLALYVIDLRRRPRPSTVVA